MNVEVPNIRRCCYCVPARYGLLFWIYLKLVLTIITLIPLIFIMFFSYKHTVEWYLIVVVAIPGLVVDVVMNIVALIGGHSKKVKLLKAYYNYSIFFLVLFIIVFIWITLQNLYVDGLLGSYHPLLWYYLVWYAMVGFASVGIQFYMLLLLRSKVHVLASNCKFRFVNNAAEAEAQCAMDIDTTFIRNCPDGQCTDIPECNSGLGEDTENQKTMK